MALSIVRPGHCRANAQVTTPNHVYLNDAATSWPKAPGVAEAVLSAITSPPCDANRSTHRSIDVLQECRKRLALLLRVPDPSTIALTTSATHGLNLAILGLGLRPGDRVVTTVTEHNSVLRPLRHLAGRLGIRVTHVGLDTSGALDMDALDRALNDRPRLVATCHASNVTGRVCDVESVFRRAHQAGAIALLDASQSLGHVDVHPLDLNADLVAFTGHKGLRGPQGTGGLYVSPGVELDQVFVGGTGVRSDLELHPPEMPMRLEAGTPNTPAFAGLLAALEWLGRDGQSHEREANRLAEMLRSGLREMDSVTVYDDTSAFRVGIVPFKIAGWSVEEAGYVLAESFGIACRTGLHCAPLIHEAIGSAPEGTIRFSISGSNTDDDVSLALNAVRRLAA